MVGSARYQTAFHQPSGSVAYRYSQLLPTFSLSFGRAYAQRTGYERYNYERPASAEDLGYRVTGYQERVTRVTGGVSVPVLRHPIHNASAGAQYSYTQYTNVDARDPVDPNAPASSTPGTGGLGQVDFSLTYDNIRAVKFGYASETGRSAGVRLTIIDRHLGGRFGDLQVAGNYTERLRMPWRGHQVLAMNLSGGAAAGGLSNRAAYFVGGYSQQEDVIRTLLMRSAIGEAGVLRGFQPGAFAGTYYTVLNAEYRIPIADVERGVGTLPLFMRRITMIPFSDLGGAWSQGFNRKALHWGVGAALVLSFKVGYLDAIDLFVQYARGFDDKYGLDTFRATVVQSF